jgi:hypothetical protein
MPFFSNPWFAKLILAPPVCKVRPNATTDHRSTPMSKRLCRAAHVSALPLLDPVGEPPLLYPCLAGGLTLAGAQPTTALHLVAPLLDGSHTTVGALGMVTMPRACARAAPSGWAGQAALTPNQAD